MDIISSLSKLLNGLVTKKVKEDIGKDVSFDVDTTKYGIIINVKGYLPEIVKNPNSDGWDTERYLDPKRMVKSMLWQALKYIGGVSSTADSVSMRFNDSSSTDSVYQGSNTSKDWTDFKQDTKTKDGETKPPTKFILTHGGAYATSKRSGISYPVFTNGNLDIDGAYHLSDIEEPDWWESLDEDDKEELYSVFG
jgi:hypothetical protein